MRPTAPEIVKLLQTEGRLFGYGEMYGPTFMMGLRFGKDHPEMADQLLKEMGSPDLQEMSDSLFDGPWPDDELPAGPRIPTMVIGLEELLQNIMAPTKTDA